MKTFLSLLSLGLIGIPAQTSGQTNEYWLVHHGSEGSVAIIADRSRFVLDDGRISTYVANFDNAGFELTMDGESHRVHLVHAGVIVDCTRNTIETQDMYSFDFYGALIESNTRVQAPYLVSRPLEQIAVNAVCRAGGPSADWLPMPTLDDFRQVAVHYSFR